MDIFDNTILQINEWMRRKIERGEAREFYPSPAADSAPMLRSEPSIILKEDTQLELGHPAAGSCYGVLATHDSTLVHGGRVTLVGPDICDARADRLPFAQIALSRCTGDIQETASLIDRTLHTSAPTDGYMLRSAPDRIWARVSKQAARSGFSLLDVGARLLHALSRADTGITASEILFVTTSREDVSSLADIVEPARQKLRKLTQYVRADDGSYECASALDCTECPEKPVCDNIREVIKIRKGDRIIVLGDPAET
jgi:CO dehydrogenase/acetyl-CoA synthase beta subunit